MMWRGDFTPGELKRELHRRLKRRRWTTGSHWCLDLRAQLFLGHTLFVVRDPEAPGWPDRGRTTSSMRKALGWVDVYVERLGVGWFTGQRNLRTVT